jgi:plastocyanin
MTRISRIGLATAALTVSLMACSSNEPDTRNTQRGIYSTSMDTGTADAQQMPDTQQMPGDETSQPTHEEGQEQGQTEPGAQTVTVKLRNMRFVPDSVTIRRGDTVRWVWDDDPSVQHTVSSGPGCKDDEKYESKPMTTPASYEHTFSDPGTFPYHCDFHCSMGMVATVVVE